MWVCQWMYAAMFFFLWGGNIAQALAVEDGGGIVLESTRAIYPSTAQRGITFTIKNHTPNVYLLQSRVILWDRNSFGIKEINETQRDETVPADPFLQNKAEIIMAPFIVLPPLNRFAPDDVITLRIQLTKNELPKDRESIFSLSLKAIPSQEKAMDDSNATKIVLALQNNFKLFYRPTEMAVMNIDERAKALRFSMHGTQLIVENPTPYYVTLGEVTVDSSQVTFVNQRMIAPFSTERYDVDASDFTTVGWTLINDDGKKTSLYTQPLS